MSNHTNHRREEKRTETGPRWENHNPGKGCNSTHVARGTCSLGVEKPHQKGPASSGPAVSLRG